MYEVLAPVSSLHYRQLPTKIGRHYADLLSLRVELFAYEPFATRVWELRESVTAYDGWYVALAESLSAQLATLDLRVTKAAGTRCAFATPWLSSSRPLGCRPAGQLVGPVGEPDRSPQA